MGALIVVTPPAIEPVTLSELKAHCRVTSSDEDTYLGGLLKAARVKVEEYTGRALITQTLRWELDRFPHRGHLLFPRAPVQLVEELRTFDEDDVTGTVMDEDDYVVDVQSEPARLVLKSGVAWPTDLEVARAVRTTFVAGYAPTESPDAGEGVPEQLKLAIKMLALTWYEHRGTLTQLANLKEVPGGIDAILGDFRAWNEFGHAAVSQEGAR